MDDMDICLDWPGWPVDDDGIKRSSATLPRIAPKDGKTPGCSTDRTPVASLTISYQLKGQEPHATGPLVSTHIYYRMPPLALSYTGPYCSHCIAAELRPAALER